MMIGMDALYLGSLAVGYVAGNRTARRWLYVALRAAALLVSFVVMAWVPVVFAVMDTMPHIVSALIRRCALVVVAMRMARGWRAVRLGVVLLLLAPVMAVLLLAEVAPVLLANLHLQLALWWRNHLRQARSQ